MSCIGWLARNRMAAGLLLVVLVSVGCTRSPEAKSAAFIEEGKKQLAKKDPARAILQFRNAIQATPKNSEAYYQLALAYLAAGDLRDGVASLRRSLELDPAHKQAQFRLADLMTNVNDPTILKDAQQRLQALLQDAPEDADALHALALTELKLGDANDAVQHLERAMANAPTELAFAVTLSQAKLEQKDPKGAEEVLKKAVASFPKSADAMVILGRFYLGQSKTAEAEQEFQSALAADPKNVPALLNLAIVQYQTGRKKEAEPNFKRISVSSDKTYQPVYANFLFEEGRQAEAIAEFERLAKENPDDRGARTRLVAAYQTANRIPDAQRVLNEALKKNGRDLDALLQRGELSLSAQKYNEAEADFNTVVHLKADSPDAHYAMARLRRAQGAAQGQRQELTETLRLNPFLMRARLELAGALMSDNAGKAALEVLDAAPEDQKNSIAILEQRNWALLVEGNEAEVQRGVARGLAAVRAPVLLLQDAILKIRAKQFVEARKSVHEALAKNPEDYRANEVLIATYRAENQLHAGIAELKASAAQHPKSADLQYLLGNLLLETGDTAGAKQALAAVKALAPNSTVADLSLAQVNLMQSNWSDARRQLTSLVSQKGDNVQAEQWLGMLEGATGNNAAAIQYFRKVIVTQPDNAIALNNLAYLLSESGDQTQEPLKFVQRALELDPKNPEYEDTFGWVLFRRGVYDVAVTHIERAISLKPTALRQYHLAMAYYRAGQQDRGRAVLTAALRTDSSLPEAKAAQDLFKTAPASGK